MAWCSCMCSLQLKLSLFKRPMQRTGCAWGPGMMSSMLCPPAGTPQGLAAASRLTAVLHAFSQPHIPSIANTHHLRTEGAAVLQPALSTTKCSSCRLHWRLDAREPGSPSARTAACLSAAGMLRTGSTAATVAAVHDAGFCLAFPFQCGCCTAASTAAPVCTLQCHACSCMPQLRVLFQLGLRLRSLGQGLGNNLFHLLGHGRQLCELGAGWRLHACAEQSSS